MSLTRSIFDAASPCFSGNCARDLNNNTRKAFSTLCILEHTDNYRATFRCPVIAKKMLTDNRKDLLLVLSNTILYKLIKMLYIVIVQKNLRVDECKRNAESL